MIKNGTRLQSQVCDTQVIVVRSAAGEPDLLYIDLHLVHEVTSPQAFESLRMHGRPVRRADLTVAIGGRPVASTMRGSSPDTLTKSDRARTRSARYCAIIARGLTAQR